MGKHRMCECCRTNFLLKDMNGDLCIICYDFIQTRIETKLAEYEAIKKKYKTIFLDRFVDSKVEDARIWKEKYDQLKQQLAEKDAEVQSWKDGTMVVKLGKLEEQLAEKEKEIEKCNDEWREICDGKLETINRLIEEKHELQQSQNQTAIAELEKLKKDFEYFGNLGDCEGWTPSEINNFIDQQIKSLKGEK